MREGQAIQKETTNQGDKLTDLNLAGFATVAMLVLFFPAVGLMAVRRRRIEARKLYDEAHLRKLIHEVVERDNERQHEEVYR